MEINSSLLPINFNSPRCPTFLFCHSSNWKVIGKPRFLWSYECMCVWGMHSGSVWGRVRKFSVFFRCLLTVLFKLYKNLAITSQVNVSTSLFLYLRTFVFKQLKLSLQGNLPPKAVETDKNRETLWLRGMGREP